MKKAGFLLLCIAALSVVHGKDHGHHGHDDDDDYRDPPPDNYEGGDANVVLCAHVKEWPSGVRVYPGLVCPVHCCQREDNVECCEEEEPEPVKDGRGRMLVLIVVASVMAVLAAAGFAFGCYKHKKAKLRKTRPTGSLNDVPVRMTTISGARYTVPRRATGWVDDFNIPKATTGGEKYKLPGGPPTYSQATREFPAAPPPYTSPQPPPSNGNGGSGKESPIPLADVPISSAPSATIYLPNY